jgi:hypothetical protein
MRRLQAQLARSRARAGDDREGGFVMVFIALTLTIMLVFAAFTVDFGSWYTRSAELKRAADAAALAGVVWMPEFDLAQQAAVDSAARNGFVDGTNDISVDVDTVPNNNRELKVTIRDNKAKQFFSKLVTGGQSIGRSSLAEYVLPVPMGSPENVFGSGDLSLPGQSTAQNFWAAVNGYCAGHESGDPKLAWWESYSTSGGCNGNNSAQNADDYDPNGYLYAINLPKDASSLKLDVYDGAYNRSGSAMDSALCSCSVSITTSYTVYDRNPTPLDTSDTNLDALAFSPAITMTTNQNQRSWQNDWANLHTWTAPKAGTYYVRVQTQAGQNNSIGSNGFVLRAYTGSNYSTCSTITGTSNYSASCPQLHAVSDMSIYANLGSGGSGSKAQFYLAQIDPIHAGKTMRVNLFDAGEGAQKLEILDPNGNPATFNWSTPCSPQTPPSGGCSGSGTSLDVSNTGCPRSGCPQPYSTVNSDSKYSDRFLTIDIPLPSNYTAVYGTKTWWKVRYTVGSSSTDRTTWSVNIVGDPVHLLQ